jgi:hypothetical protein
VGPSVSSASAVASGTSSLPANRTGARSGEAISTEAAMPARQSSSFTIETILGREVLERPG